MSLFVKYLQAIAILPLLLEKFGGLKKSRKGVTLKNLFFSCVAQCVGDGSLDFR
jgi:hypothetical protein